MIRTIFIDLDGPILDGRFRHYQCYSDILRENGYTPISLDAYWKMKRQRLDRHRQLVASGADGIYDAFLLAWHEKIEQKRYLALDRLQPGAFARMQEWRTNGMMLTLVTMRNNGENLRWQLGTFNLSELFDRILAVGTADGWEGKAAAARPLVKEAGASSVAWIGDTEADIEAARALNVTACVVGCGLRTQDYLATLSPDFLFPDLDSVNFPEGG
jgi:phosphoglycolate phosphatase